MNVEAVNGSTCLHPFVPRTRWAGRGLCTLHLDKRITLTKRNQPNHDFCNFSDSAAGLHHHLSSYGWCFWVKFRPIRTKQQVVQANM